MRIKSIFTHSAQAIAEGAAWIARGEVTQVLAGATDSMINPMGVGCFSLLGALWLTSGRASPSR